jgi:ABC-type multidrug transport system ATPase subunit
VVILSAGQVIAQGSVSEVTGRSQLEPSALRIHVEPASVREAQQALEVIPVVSRVTPMGENEGWLRVEVLAPQDRVRRNSHPANNRILQALIRARVPILSFEPEGGRLQDIFLQLTEARR